MAPGEKPLVWLHGQIKTPPFSQEARIEAGYLLGRLQQGENLRLPQSRLMPSIGRRCHELRVPDKGRDWRIVYRIDADAIVKSLGKRLDSRHRALSIRARED